MFIKFFIAKFAFNMNLILNINIFVSITQEVQEMRENKFWGSRWTMHIIVSIVYQILPYKICTYVEVHTYLVPSFSYITTAHRLIYFSSCLPKDCTCAICSWVFTCLQKDYTCTICSWVFKVLMEKIMLVQNVHEFLHVCQKITLVQYVHEFLKLFITETSLPIVTNFPQFF